MRTSRFPTFTPSALRTSSLRRLKTAFSPSASSSVSSARSFTDETFSPRSAPSSRSSTGTASPFDSLSECGCSDHGQPQHGRPLALDAVVDDDFFAMPTATAAVAAAAFATAPARKTIQRRSSGAARLRALIMRRRRWSSWDCAVEEDRRAFGPQLAVFEPRHRGDVAMAGIFEVLDQGKA
jgi:hypothetical protein